MMFNADLTLVWRKRFPGEWTYVSDIKFFDSTKIVLVLSDKGTTPGSTLSIAVLNRATGALLSNSNDDVYSPPHYAVSRFDSLHLGYSSS